MANKKLSRSAGCAARLLHQTLQMLAAADDGTLPYSDICTRLAETGSLSEWERALTNSGNPRWRTFLTFYASNYKRAGLLFRQRLGLWSITDTGLDALQKYDAEGLFRFAMETAPTNQQTINLVEAGDDPAGGVAAGTAPTPAAVDVSAIFEDYENKSRDDIFSYLRAADPYVFQNMVAALLRGMGYFVPFVAPKGKDGGVDVVAFSDPLGAKQPILKVQVKHYDPSNPVAVDVINALLGVTLGDGSVPVVVTSGRFTDAAKVKARASNVRLIDGDEFISLWVEYYSKMDEEDRALMPIRPFYFIKRI